MSLYSVMTYAALRAEVSGHVCENGSWKDVADKSLTYWRELEDYELEELQNAGVIHENVDLSEFHTVESIITIRYDCYGASWEDLKLEKDVIKHEIVADGEGFLYENYDIETTISVIDSCFRINYMASE